LKNPTQQIQKQKVPLYEEIAKEIISQVELGIYKPGDRIPSLRKISQVKRISINTAKEAYYLLEDRRVIEVRPQSGYFIKHKWPKPPQQIKFIKNDINPTQVTTSELLQMVSKDLANRDLIQLGVIDINNTILPVKKLNNLLSSQIRKYDSISVSSIQVIGLERLRVQIAKMYAEIGCNFDPDDVYITSGCTEGIILSLLAICKPGHTIAVEMPVFASLLQIIEKLDHKIIGIPSDPESGVSIETLEYALNNNKIDAFISIPNFNNPLGSVLSSERKEKLVRMLSKYDIPIIEDDIYGDLSFSDNRPDVLKAHDKTGNVILCSSVTKTLAPGYRIGWVIPGKYKEQFESVKIMAHNTASTPIQLVLAEFLENGGYERYLRKIRKIYAVNMAKMAEALGKFFPAGTHVTHPKGGFFLWVEMPENVDSVKLYTEALKEGITIMPGPLFSTSNKFRNCIRLNTAYWSPKIEEAIKSLGKLVHQLLLDESISNP
jgi:DNA-binding transcriptional MocR family regulator